MEAVGNLKVSLEDGSLCLFAVSSRFERISSTTEDQLRRKGERKKKRERKKEREKREERREKREGNYHRSCSQ